MKISDNRVIGDLSEEEFKKLQQGNFSITHLDTQLMTSKLDTNGIELINITFPLSDRDYWVKPDEWRELIKNYKERYSTSTLLFLFSNNKFKQELIGIQYP